MASRQSWKYERMSVFRRFPYLDGLFLSFFQLWRLAILEPVGVQIRNVPHFKGLIVLYLDLRSSRAWQYIYPPPHPLEKGHFTPKTAKCPRTFVANCILVCLLCHFYNSLQMFSHYYVSSRIYWEFNALDTFQRQEKSIWNMGVAFQFSVCFLSLLTR